MAAASAASVRGSGATGTSRWFFCPLATGGRRSIVAKDCQVPFSGSQRVSSHQLRYGCVSLGIAVLHSRPYLPEGAAARLSASFAPCASRCWPSWLMR